MKPTLDEFQRYLKYNPLTGHFTWIRSSSEVRCTVGSRAGSLQVSGYRHIAFKSRKYREHLLAVLYMTGEWPTRCDHCDRNRANNAWTNLRLATRSQNAANSALQKRNQSGYKGVYLQGGRWRAQIRVNRRIKHLGYFTSAEIAHEAYKVAAAAAFGEFARFS